MDNYSLFLLAIACLILASILYTIPIYIYELLRGRKWRKIASKFNLKYSQNFNFLSLCPLTRPFISKDILEERTKRHKLLGSLNDHQLEIYDVHYIPSGIEIFGMEKKTVVHFDGKEMNDKSRLLKQNELEEILKRY